MSKRTLLSIGFAFLAGALPPSAPAVAASPAKSAPTPAATTDIIFNRVFIFFRNDDTTLTPHMIKLVTRAAELAKQGGATRIKIAGYSDDPKRADTLSQSRADVVKAQLIKEGIEPDMIETQARVKAPPASTVGGPNPANHRVRITLLRALTAPVGPHDGAR
jgi:outer membrane protein OmpA-like peptidoglycan-associated protein